MAYQRGSTKERISLAERFKGLLRRTILSKGAGNIAYGIGRGLGFGTLSSFGIGQAASLATMAIQARVSKPKPKRVTRTQGSAKRRNGVRRVAKATRGAAKAGVKKGAVAFRRRFGAAAKQAAKEGLRVGTKEFGKRMRELL